MADVKLSAARQAAVDRIKSQGIGAKKAAGTLPVYKSKTTSVTPTVRTESGRISRAKGAKKGLVFDEILLKGIRSGQMPAKENDARKWYRNLAKQYRQLSETKMMKDGKDRLTNKPAIGNMFHFFYDAKHKKTLPYFDRFPLIFPFSKVEGGFMGINLHYLPLPLRAKLMDSLYEITNNKRYDETTKLKITYGVLSEMGNLFKPCVKMYLTSHLRSRFMYIYPSEWDIALFLPSHRFDGATASKVWADSRKIIQKSKYKVK